MHEVHLSNLITKGDPPALPGRSKSLTVPAVTPRAPTDETSNGAAKHTNEIPSMDRRESA
jgi:hypothetical protein